MIRTQDAAGSRDEPSQHEQTSLHTVIPGGAHIMYRNLSYLIAGILCAGVLQGCNQNQVDPAKVQADVTKAQADGQKMIVDAQAKLDKVVAANNKDIVSFVLVVLL